MKRFIKDIILFLSPVFVILLIFILSDPFGIFFYAPSLEEQNKFGAEPDFHTTLNLLEFGHQENFNSFIIGNSRCTAILPVDLESRIPESKFFNYGTPGESLTNIYKKLQLIENESLEINNVIIFIDDKVVLNTQNKVYDKEMMTYVHHPLTSNQNYISFYSTGLKMYLSKFYFVRDIDYKLTGKYKPYMSGFIKNPDLENGLPIGYVFPPREQAGTESGYTFHPIDIRILAKIKALLDENKADFKIVIPPNYDQIEFNKKNIKVLDYFFGSDNIYNYSGINEITSDTLNFYEEGHFKVEIGQRIIEDLYP